MSKELSTSLKNAVKGTALIFAGTVAGNILWFVIKIVIVRKLTVEEFGLYSLAITIPTVFAALAALGTGEGTVRNIASLIGEDKRGDADSLARASLHINIISSTTAGILLFLLAGIMARYVFYKPDIAVPLRILSITVPLFTLIGILGSILRGHGFVRHKIYYQDLGQPLYYLAFMSILLITGFTFLKLIYAYTLSVTLVFVSLASYEYKKLYISPLPLIKGMHYQKLLQFSLPLLIAGISSLVLNWTDTLMLGRYTPPASVGIYNVGLSLAQLMNFVLMSLSFVFLPMASEMYAKDQLPELKKTYRVLTKWVFTATFPLFFILFFFPEMTIAFLFGWDLVAASLPLRILAAGFLFHVFMGPNGLLLMAIGKTKTIMQISIATALLNVVLNYILIKRFGMDVVGAAAASLVSYVLANLLTAAVLYRSSGIHPFTLRYIKPILGASAMGLLIYFLVKKIFFAWWLMPIYLILFVFGYTASLLLSRSMDSDDIALFMAVLKRTGIRAEWLQRLIHQFANKKY
ncbi:MAG: flippase [Desulfobulbaceae bacterium]|nr:flippase [Desulfobulbaceae bacterium]